MKYKIFTTLCIVVVSMAFAYAQSVTVSGNYYDRKGNPIEEAFIKYFYFDGLAADSTYSSSNGFFSLDVNTIVNIEENRSAIFTKPYPNPFHHKVYCEFNISGFSVFHIYNNDGKVIDKVELNNPGQYRLKWGGQDKNGNNLGSGIYYFALDTQEEIITRKVIYQESYSNNGKMEIEYLGAGVSQLKAINNTDKLTFTHENASFSELFILNPTQDTSLGVLVGNIGPSGQSSLISTVHIDSTNIWNLNDYFYNDDQSNYETTDVNFIIQDDSLMVFVGSSIDVYDFTIIATDTTDSILTDTMSANITVTNELIITLTGTYKDKLDYPIESAEVIYYKYGDVLTSQVSTNVNGDFELTFYSFETSYDSIFFHKENTSQIHIGLYTPTGDSVLGTIVGNLGPTNTGSINETHFTIEEEIQWNINDYFTNDDQTIFSIVSSDFIITQDTLVSFTGTLVGSYTDAVTGTDPDDATLVDYLDIDVDYQYTINVPDTSLLEDSDGDTLFTNLNTYVNPNYTPTLSYQIVNQSNPQLINLVLAGSTVLIDSLHKDNSGLSTIEIEITDNTNVDTIFFTITILPCPDVFGNVYDIFDSTLLSSVILTFAYNGDTIIDTSDNNGNYNIQLSNISDTAYFTALLERDDYTPFHSWATFYDNYDSLYNYTMIDTAFDWGLYNLTLRGLITGSSGGGADKYKRCTRHWWAPPSNFIFYDSISGSGDYYSITDSIEYNIKNMLPLINKEDVDTNNINKSGINSPNIGEGTIYCSFNRIVPFGSGYAAGIAGFSTNGLCIVKGITAYSENLVNSNNNVFLQEHGTVYGAISEPPSNYPPKHYTHVRYATVYADPCSINTYSEADLEMAKVFQERSKIHYHNGNLPNPHPTFNYSPNLQDWEGRPDSVDYYYSQEHPHFNMPLFHFKVSGGSHPLEGKPLLSNEMPDFIKVYFKN